MQVAKKLHEALPAFCDRANAAIDFVDLRTIALKFFAENDVSMVSYHHLPPVGALDREQYFLIHTDGFPQAWADQYRNEQLYEHDPIVKAAASSVGAFLWSEVGQIRDLDHRERSFLKLLAKAVPGDGLAVPVFGPLGRNGYFGLGFGIAPVTLDIQARLRFQTACQRIHLRYCELVLDRLPQNVRLSDRETEILRSMSQGRSSAETASHLAISIHTVDTYIRRIFAKLDVDGRVAATLRGLALGLID